MKQDLLIIVDKKDKELCTWDKLSVHKSGLLHRAFSIFIFNSKDELLLQQRADEKYHSAGLWSNTCCSHPIKNENISDSIIRRLHREIGMKCETEFQFKFIYKYQFENGLTEHELDHVYFGKSDDLPKPDPGEVKDWKYISLPNLEKEIVLHPEIFSAWLQICLPEVIAHFKNKSQQ